MISTLSPSINSFLNGISRVEQVISSTTAQITSGYRISQPSDAPDQISPLLQLMAEADHNQGLLENLSTVQATVSSADQATSSAIQLLDTATSLGAQGANTTVTAETRAGLASQVESIQEQLVALADTQVSGSYIFAGDQVSSQPYAIDLNPPPVVMGNAKATVVAPGDAATFTIQTASGNQTVAVNGSPADTLQGQLNNLNNQLKSQAITASLDAAGNLQFQSANAFSISAVATTATNLVGTSPVILDNTGLNTYQFSGQAVGAGGGNDIQITANGTTVSATLPDGLATADQANIDAINSALQQAGVSGVTAVLDLSTASTISFQGSANFSVADDHAVAGTFVTDGHSVTAQANGVDRQIAPQQATRQIELADHTSTVVDQTAQDLFDHRNADDSLAPDNVFAALNSLRLALLNNDTSAITTAQTSLHTASQYLNSREVFYGTTANRLDSAITQLNSENTNLQQQISAIRDTDVVQATLTLTAAETQNQAALDAEAKLPRTTLFDYLG